LGTDAAIVWHGISGKGYSRNKIFSFSLITAAIQLLFFYIIAILGFLFLGHTLLGGSYELSIFFAELTYFTGLVCMDKFLSLYYSQQETRLCNKILAIVSGILFLILLVIWIALPGLISKYPIWIYSLFIFIPSLILSLFFLVRFNPVVTSISQEELKSFSSFSFIVLISNTIQFIAYRADYWLLSIYYDHDVVGVYAQAAKFAQVLWIIPGILAGLITPALKHQERKLTDSELLSLCRVTFYTHFVFSVILISVSFFIYKFFLPPDYYNGFSSLLIMIPGYLVYIITTILAAYFSANRLLKINLSGAILCCLLIVILDLLLIPSMSFKGAAIANLLAYSVTTFYIMARSKQFISASFKEIFSIRKSDFNLFSSRIPPVDKQTS
jgi:O-antigen/teichoic acid export membrane protein